MMQGTKLYTFNFLTVYNFVPWRMQHCPNIGKKSYTVEDQGPDWQKKYVWDKEALLYRGSSPYILLLLGLNIVRYIEDFVK